MKGSQGIYIVFLQFIGSQEKNKCQDHHCCCHLFSLSCIIFTLVCCHYCSHHHHHHHHRHHHHWATTMNLSYILIHHVKSNALIFWFFIFYIDYSTHKNCIFRRSESLERTLKQRDVPRQRAASYSPPAKK